jgi:hypothetical protein
MALNGISTETVYNGSGVVDPIATKIKRRNDKLALAETARQSHTASYRVENQLTGTHRAYVNGASGPSLQTLSGTASPNVGHPWSEAASGATFNIATSALGAGLQVACTTYVACGVQFTSNGVTTNSACCTCTGVELLSFSTATSNALTSQLGAVSTTPYYHTGVYSVNWAAGSTTASTFANVYYYCATHLGQSSLAPGNANGQGIRLTVVDGNCNALSGTWNFPATFTFINKIN